MEAVLLGTGGWTPTDARETACVYLRQGDRVVLLDAGTGVRRLLTSPGLLAGVSRVDVCLSHFHLDHVVGLTYLPGLGSEVERHVWGPGAALYGTATAEVLGRVISPPLFALDLPDVVASVEELPIAEVGIGPFTLAVRVQERHTQPSVALRVGDDLAYCTDTGYDPGNAPFAAGCHHLLHEAFWLDEKNDDTHSTAAEAASVAQDGGVSHLTLVHLNPRLDDTDRFLTRAAAVFANSHLGHDLAALS